MSLTEVKKSQIFLLILSLYFIWCVSDPASWGLLDNVDLLIHEAGHFIFPRFLVGEFLNIVAGSFFQVFIPAIFAGYFYFKKDLLSASVVLFWVGQSLANVSVYAGDAVRQALPLVGGESVIHDWNYILQNLGLLSYTGSVELFIHFLAWLCILAGIVFGFNSVTESK